MASLFVDRVASTDKNYLPGDLSVYPLGLDDKIQLYETTNNAETVTTQSTSYNSSYFIVKDASGFPNTGLIMVGTEQVYYTIKTVNSFRGLKRGFAGSRQNAWPIGTSVKGAVCAEPHNVLKDAVINIENNLGLSVNPTAKSLNGILESLEARFLAPNPMFRAAPRFGVAPFQVFFQNFSEGPAIRYLWDFGDGATSQEHAPFHTYLANGTYTVTLTMITSLGAQGITTKSNYIFVSDGNTPAFFYVSPSAGSTSTTFNFIDQSEGQIASRYWVWGDGTTSSFTDPDMHTATHQYTTAGTYNPSLLLIFVDGSKNIVYAPEPIIVG
jgi:PKD repeat protein